MFKSRKPGINPVKMWETFALRQAYASGRNAGRLATCSNPHPRESEEYTYWANGYIVGLGERKR